MRVYYTLFFTKKGERGVKFLFSQKRRGEFSQINTKWGGLLSFDHRGSSAAGDAPEPTRLRAGRRHALKQGWWDSEKRQKLLQHIKKSPQSVDTERGNGYNTYRVRPKRSANI